MNGVWDGEWPLEMDMFFSFLAAEVVPRGWKPYRTEWSIFDEDHMVAGQIDSLWIDVSNGSLHMIDWKRCLKPLNPQDGERFNRWGLPPCDFLLDNSFGHYAVQQNLYATILRDNYGVKLSSMWLVQLHIDRPSYSFIPVPAFLDVARVLLHRTAPSRGSHPLDRLGGAPTPKGPLGGTPAPASDADWQLRQAKRSASVVAIKRTSEYLLCQALDRTRPVPNRMTSPDPFDKTISKRGWETGIMDWRSGLRAQANLYAPSLNCCFLKSLWSLGVPVPVTRDGPFHALLDGNMLLLDFDLSLEPILAEAVVPGKYVRWHDGHFVGVEVFDSHILVHDNGECTSLFQLEQLVLDATTTFFQLIPYPGISIFDGRWNQNHDRLGGAGESQQTQERGFDQLLEEEEAEASLELAESMHFAAAMQDTVGAGPEGPWANGPEEVIAADQATHSRRADIPGSKTSSIDFNKLFDACSAGADATLLTAEADVEKGRSSIQERTRDLTEMVTARHRTMLKE
jgi:hypothetical protein